MFINATSISNIDMDIYVDKNGELFLGHISLGKNGMLKMVLFPSSLTPQSSALIINFIINWIIL